MFHYVLKRLLLMIPTLLGILLINFIIVQAAPGGPVEQMIATLTGAAEGGATARFSGSASGDMASSGVMRGMGGGANSTYRGAQGLDPELIARIEKYYGFDKPAHERFFDMLKNYATFNFGDSFFKSQSVSSLLLEKLPVSISLGLWTTLIVYGISIPLGIKKAITDGSRFDVWTSAMISIGYAIPGFLFAILLIVLFAGGSYWNIFPLRGLVSPGWEDFTLVQKILDYFWHLILPVLAMVIGGFASLTLLVKNSFIDQISQQYVLTARSKGLSERRVLYGHVFRNAMLIVVAGLPSALIGILFTSAMLIEIIFSLDGLGLLGFEAVIQRDYPVVFGSLFIFTLLGLITNLIGDLVYVAIDPRIDFERRDM
jgi:microcin C transport system permease protein